MILFLAASQLLKIYWFALSIRIMKLYISIFSLFIPLLLQADNFDFLLLKHSGEVIVQRQGTSIKVKDNIGLYKTDVLTIGKQSSASIKDYDSKRLDVYLCDQPIAGKSVEDVIRSHQKGKLEYYKETIKGWNEPNAKETSGLRRGYDGVTFMASGVDDAVADNSESIARLINYTIQCGFVNCTKTEIELIQGYSPSGCVSFILENHSDENLYVGLFAYNKKDKSIYLCNKLYDRKTPILIYIPAKSNYMLSDALYVRDSNIVYSCFGTDAPFDYYAIEQNLSRSDMRSKKQVFIGSRLQVK